MTTTADYPEHVKQSQHLFAGQTIGEFLEWLSSQGVMLMRYNEFSDEFESDHRSINQLLADYFEIDLNAIETEKRAMLDRMREANNVA